MKLEQQVCSLELAKRLKELGVKQESLFYWAPRAVGTKPQIRYRGELDKRTIHHKILDCAAFTVAELGEMLARGLTHSNKRADGKGWRCGYIPVSGDGTETIHYETADTEADARAKMLIYLIENDLWQVAAEK